MYNNYYQPMQTPSPAYSQRSIPGLKGRLVSSMDEARASAIDFDGTVFYFPDLANNCIYTKQINIDGTATLLKYELQENSIASQSEFITREEFEKVITELKNNLATTHNSSQPESKPITQFKF